MATQFPSTIIVIALRSFSVERELIRPGGAMHFHVMAFRVIYRGAGWRESWAKKKKKKDTLFLLCREKHTFSPDTKFHTVTVYWELKKIKKKEKRKRGMEKQDKKKNDETRGGREEWKYRAKIVGNSTLLELLQKIFATMRAIPRSFYFCWKLSCLVPWTRWFVKVETNGPCFRMN